MKTVLHFLIVALWSVSFLQADTWVKVQRFASATATGTQDLTISGIGTPKAVIVVASYATTNATAENHASISVGFSDGVADKASTSFSQHGLANTDTYHFQANNLINMRDGGGGPAWVADFSAWITDGVRINWTTVQGTAVFVTVIYFGGTDVQADVGQFTMSATLNAATAITDPGFTPDQVFTISYGDTVWPTTTTTHGGITLGVADNGSNQFAQNSFEQDAVAAGDPRERMYNTRVGGFFNGDSQVELTSWDANGFTVTQRGASGTAYILGYLAVKYGTGVSHWAGIVDTPIATGSQAVTSPGFQPQFIGFASNHMEVVNTQISTQDAGTWGVCAADGTREFNTSFQSEEASATTDTQSFSASSLVHQPPDDGSTTSDLIATFTSFDTLGYTLNWTAVDTAGAKKFGVWAVGLEVTARRRSHVGIVGGGGL